MARLTEHRRRVIGVAALLLILAVLAHGALLSLSWEAGPNYRNVSIDARVNISNAIPEILAVIVTDPITLNAGSTVDVQCNVSVRDWNGGNTIANVSAVLYDSIASTMGAPDHNNDHYTNASCFTNTTSGYYANFTCDFTLYYYANPGFDTWVCNVTVSDSYAFGGNVSGTVWDYNTTTIEELLALNVTPLIDYGNMAVGETSVPQEANVTNFGNMDINVSVKGYGQTEGDGLSFVCQVGDIGIEHQRFSLDALGDYIVDYTPLDIAYQMMDGLTIVQQTDELTQEINSTYWRLYVPPNPFGECNGTIVFQAESAT